LAQSLSFCCHLSCTAAATYALRDGQRYRLLALLAAAAVGALASLHIECREGLELHHALVPYTPLKADVAPCGSFTDLQLHEGALVLHVYKGERSKRRPVLA
jgi:hypothetical protein